MFTTIRMAACALTFVIATAALADVYCARCRCTVHVNHDTDCPICGQHLHFGGGGGGGGGMGDPGFQLGLFLYQAGPEVKVSRATGASAGVFYPNDTLVQGGFYDTRTGIKYKIWISVV
ncbi:MAG: hypothetical protein KDB01_27350, partial [Planctomycetaceae bacterium]|nr:hypothetical protein [Planctomycetaceae bacterium]